MLTSMPKSIWLIGLTVAVHLLQLSPVGLILSKRRRRLQAAYDKVLVKKGQRLTSAMRNPRVTDERRGTNSLTHTQERQLSLRGSY